jgi:sugar lactone lactonase YvrE
VAVDAAGNLIVVLASHQIVLVAARDGVAYGVTCQAGRVYRIAGAATSRSPSSSPDPADFGGSARGFETTLKAPGGIALDVAGNLFVAERLANRILRVDRQTGVLTAIAGDRSAGPGEPGYFGDGGPAASARLADPVDLAWEPGNSPDAGSLYVFDAGNNAIRRIAFAASKAGRIETLAGSGPGSLGWSGDGAGALTNLADPALYQVAPGGLAVDPANRRLFFSDTNNFRIRMIDLTAGTPAVETVAGGDAKRRGRNFRDGEATSCAVMEPTRLAVDPAGNLVFSDRYQYVYRKLHLSFGR